METCLSMSWLWWSVISVSMITMVTMVCLWTMISDLTVPHPRVHSAHVRNWVQSAVDPAVSNFQGSEQCIRRLEFSQPNKLQQSNIQHEHMAPNDIKGQTGKKMFAFPRKCPLLTIKVIYVSSFVPCLRQWGKVEADEGLMPRSYGGSATPEAVHQTHRRGHGGLPSKQARWGSRPAVVAGPLTLKDLWRSKSNTQQEREQQRGRTER